MICDKCKRKDTCERYQYIQGRIIDNIVGCVQFVKRAPESGQMTIDTLSNSRTTIVNNGTLNITM